MLKLIKIINSGVNVPEPVRLPKDDAAIVAGAALVFAAGKANYATTGEKPTHVSLSASEEGEKTVLCYEIHDNMIFEAPVLALPTSISVGDKLALATAGGAPIGLSATTAGGVATVISTDGACVEGDTVSFKF